MENKKVTIEDVKQDIEALEHSEGMPEKDKKLMREIFNPIIPIYIFHSNPVYDAEGKLTGYRTKSLVSGRLLDAQNILDNNVKTFQDASGRIFYFDKKNRPVIIVKHELPKDENGNPVEPKRHSRMNRSQRRAAFALASTKIQRKEAKHQTKVRLGLAPNPAVKKQAEQDFVDMFAPAQKITE